MRVSGERVSSPEGGFKPTWERHVAAYAAAAELLPPDGPVLDVGCGVGHSYHLLLPRETVGVDIEPEALIGQERRTMVADMRELPCPTAASARSWRCSRSSTCPTQSACSPRRGACSSLAVS